MTPDAAVNQCCTDTIFQPAVSVSTVPVPETHAQVCALFGFTCLGAHNRQMCFPLEHNPILKIITERGRFPSDEFIKKFIPQPFLILEMRYRREPTIEEMYYYWEIEHQHVQEGETPVSIVEITKLGTGGSHIHLCGKPIGQNAVPGLSGVIFNHLGYPVEKGTRAFVHNYEIAILVPPDFPL